MDQVKEGQKEWKIKGDQIDKRKNQMTKSG